ncbi:ABC transporter permease [Clostridium botulinum]|uniref:ABC transporter permease n=1 Tax=Clostridium botulinum TaxID=1491 RepID=UPI0033A7D1A2
MDNDNTKFTKLFINEMGKYSKINYLSEPEVKKSLINFKNDYVIEIPKGFTEEIIKGKNKNIKGYEIDGINASVALKFNIENFIKSSRNIGEYAKGNEKIFYDGMDNYKKGILNIDLKNMDSNEVSKKNIMFSLGILIFNMLILAINITPIILQDKKTKVYYRIFTAPISAKNYTFQNLMSFLAIIIAQILIIFIFMINILNIKIPNFKNIFLLFIMFSIFVVAFSLFISNISKDKKTVSIISTLTVTPMAMLGGCFWPIEIMPNSLQQVSKFVPVTWMMEGIRKLLYNSNLNGVLREVSILVLFSIVFLLLASWREKDVVNL